MAIGSKSRSLLTVALVGIIVVVLGAIVAMAVIYAPAYLKGAGPAPVTGPTVEEPSGNAVDRLAAETAVTAFYDAANVGDYTALASMVTSETTSAVTAEKLKDWKQTTFSAVRTVLDTDTAFVYGKESTATLSGTEPGVKFTLVRKAAGEAWLIDAWQAIDQGTLDAALPKGDTGKRLQLSEATAFDIVSTLLQARQEGDRITISMLTTTHFQDLHGSVWLSGQNNTANFLAYTLTGAKEGKSAWVVSTRERWTDGIRLAEYIVVMRGETIMVDRWTPVRPKATKRP